MRNLRETLSHRRQAGVELDKFASFRVLQSDNADVGQYLLTGVFDRHGHQVVTKIGLAKSAAKISR